jgi:hypothetical protein
MTNALMVGYARKGYTIQPKLTDALAFSHSKIPTINSPQLCVHSKHGVMNEAVQISQHKRTFKYIENGENAPPITLRHLWLKRD